MQLRLESEFPTDIFMRRPPIDIIVSLSPAHYVVGRNRSGPINPTDIYMTSLSYKHNILPTFTAKGFHLETIMSLA